MSENMMIATEDDLSGRFLTYYIGNALYGIELMNVTEIISVQPITRVPGLPAYVRGVINLRGKILPVVDARLKLNSPPREYDAFTCIVVLSVGGLQVGLIVDRVDQVVTFDPSQLTRPQELGHRFLSSIADLSGKTVLNLDYEKLLAETSA